MKAIVKLISAAILLFMNVQLNAQDDDKHGKKRYDHFKERTISKTYAASGNSLNIDNQFGDIKITTWDKNEIKVDIHIEASSTDKQFAEKTFERLDVKDKQEGKEITLTTVVAELDLHCKNCSNTMRVDYEIQMPASNKLSIENSFGHITLPDYTGPVSIKSEYGGVTAGKMSKLEKLEVGFGKAKLKDLSNADVKFSYTSINIDNLSGSNKIKMEFCPYSKIILDKDLSSLTLDDSYSVVHLKPVANFSASYDISTSYGSFFDKTGAGIKRTDQPSQYGPDLDKHYSGKSGSGAAKIVIKSSFGSVMIGEGSEADMKKKKEGKVI
jgi:hypothetical protein